MSLTSLTSYWALNLVQAAVVLLPGVARARWLDAVRSRWLLIAGPAAAAIGLTFLPRVAAVLANDLSLIALVFVPPLAALGIAWAIRWRDVRLVPLIPLLVALAWKVPDSPLGECAALVLVALSCVALAVVVVAVVPRAVVKLGIVAWAAADLSLALAHGLVEASRAISQAAPPIAPQLLHLQLQRVVIGSASMEYADLFVAATLGAILAAESRHRGQAALVVAVVAMSLAGFLLVTNVIPATVPVAVALALEELQLRWPRNRTRLMRVSRRVAALWLGNDPGRGHRVGRTHPRLTPRRAGCARSHSRLDGDNRLVRALVHGSRDGFSR
jgi:hypothetical protein